MGLLASPIGITSTYLGRGGYHEDTRRLAVRDGGPSDWMLPVVAETYDGWLSDRAAFAITPRIAMEAFDTAPRTRHRPKGMSAWWTA